MFKNILTGLTLLLSSSVYAGDKVGNGGGLWTCQSGQNLQHGMLVDLYEAEEEFSLQLISTTETNPMEIVEDQNQFFKKNLPTYFYNWSQILSSSMNKIKYVNAELTIIDDSLFRVKPLSSTCATGWNYTQFANFTNQDQILIRADLWKSPQISPLHKAALIWHEVIYTWLRNQYKDTDSVRARQIVGLLFSTLPANEISNRIDKVLSPLPTPNQSIWLCTIENAHTFLIFGAYGQNLIEAQTTVTQKCQNAEFGFHCNEHKINCEEISEQSIQKTCKLKNYHTNKSYLGKGRNLLEAHYKVQEQCQTDPESQPIHCTNNIICE